MIINAENIEELIFDYYEGNLSDSSKNDLLNYIHLNPEYESDFANWAKSYLLTEDKPKDYGMEYLLYKKDSYFSITKFMIDCGIVILFSTIIGFSFFNYFQKNVHVDKGSVYHPKYSKKNTDVQNHQPGSVISNFKKEIKHKKDEFVELKINQSLLLTDTPINQVVNAEIKEDSIIVNESQSFLKVDSFSVIVEKEQPKLDLPKKVKKKNVFKLKFDYKQKEDFKLINPNF